MTRSQAEQAVIRRLRGWMTACGLTTTDEGTNADLAGPIADALRALGLPLIDPSEPSDVDLAAIPAGREAAFLGACRLYAMEACLGNYTEVDETAGTDSQKASQLADRIAEAIAALRRELLEEHGLGRRRGRGAAVGPIDAGRRWPPTPPPPLSRPPWPEGSTGRPRWEFNP